MKYSTVVTQKKTDVHIASGEMSCAERSRLVTRPQLVLRGWRERVIPRQVMELSTVTWRQWTAVIMRSGRFCDSVMKTFTVLSELEIRLQESLYVLLVIVLATCTKFVLVTYSLKLKL